MTHLCTRSYFSLLNGNMSPDKIVALAKASGYNAIALTERHRLHSALDFNAACKAANMKPIFGLEVTIEDEGVIYDSLLLAKNNEGYLSLAQFSSLLVDGIHLSLELIAQHQANLIILFYGENGPFEQFYGKQMWSEVEEKMRQLKALLPDFYLAISHQESSFFRPINEKLRAIGTRLDIKACAVPKVYYEKEDDEMTFRILHAIDKGILVHDKTLVSAPNRHFLDKASFIKLYDEPLRAVVDEIVSQCSVNLDEINTSLPSFPTPNNVTSELYLIELAKFGLKKRGKGDDLQYQKRLEHELNVITSMNFADYFLIVYDMVRFAKKNNIYVGPGRGSAGGSLVAYSLGITEVDPIAYGLIFERFLNPERSGMPDIDIDFPDDKRDTVINYMREQYGDDHIAHIVTYGTMKARQAFRDVARVFAIPVRQVDQVSKMIQSQNLAQAYQDNKKLRYMIEENEKLKEVYKYALRIQNIPRHTSLHAAGIVISKKKLIDCVPVFHQNDGSTTIQYDMNRIEAMGLIKMDLLGIRNLSIIDNIKKDLPQLNLAEIPLADKKTLQLLGEGQTLGLFQLESDGMTHLLQKMKPRRFLDLVDAIALYRPGPMENIPVYLANRASEKEIEKVHPILDDITKDTYGVLIYQEQIMQIAQAFAGFSLAKADILRKAMSSKNRKQILSLEKEFIEGAVKKGEQKEMAHYIFDLIERFADYGFNKAHSVPYARIAYEMAYLKAHYPLNFYTYLLGSVIGNANKTSEYIKEIKKNKIKLSAMNLNLSGLNYKVIDGKMMMPFTMAKGISHRVASIIIKEREENGPYNNFFQTIARLQLVKLGRHHFLALIKSGAFDIFGKNRQSLLASLDDAIGYSQLVMVSKDKEKFLNFSLVSEPRFRNVAENRKETLTDELATLGFYFSNHPASSLQEKHSTDLVSEVVIRQKPYRIIAMIERIKQHRTKQGKMMAFVEVSDASGHLDTVIFPNIYTRINELLEPGAIILLKGTCKDEGSIIVSDVYRFKE